MKIKSITSAGTEDVYNMEVDETHDYAVENGIIVHNCRYVLMSNPIAARANVLQQIDLDDPLNQRLKNKKIVNYINI